MIFFFSQFCPSCDHDGPRKTHKKAGLSHIIVKMLLIIIIIEACGLSAVSTRFVYNVYHALDERQIDADSACSSLLGVIIIALYAIACISTRESACQINRSEQATCMYSTSIFSDIYLHH